MAVMVDLDLPTGSYPIALPDGYHIEVHPIAFSAEVVVIHRDVGMMGVFYPWEAHRHRGGPALYAQLLVDSLVDALDRLAERESG